MANKHILNLSIRRTKSDKPNLTWKGFLLFYFCQEIRREEINKKLEEAEQKEKEELSSQRKELFTERRTKQAALRLLQRKVDMAELVGKEKNPVPDLRLFSRFDLPINLQWLTGFLLWHIVIQSFKERNCSG